VKGRAAGALLILVAWPTASAHADPKDDKQACATAYEQGQRLRRDHALVESRDRFVTCSRVCPATLQTECSAWLSEVNRALPSVVLGARLANGRDVADVQVSLDGKPFVERLDGKAMELDPGEHLFSFRREGGEPAEERVVIREGEKERALSVVMSSPVSAPVPRSESQGASTIRPIPVAVWALLGVGAVGLGTFAGFGLAGRSEQSSTLDRCSPDCSEAQVNDVLRKYIVADLSLGVAAAALATATVLFLTRPARGASRAFLGGPAFLRAEF
jgi:hypothetical protein